MWVDSVGQGCAGTVLGELGTFLRAEPCADADIHNVKRSLALVGGQATQGAVGVTARKWQATGKFLLLGSWQKNLFKAKKPSAPVSKETVKWESNM